MVATTASQPLYAGFDLGTTNSAAAVFDGEHVRVVRNREGANLTPSVVPIDRQGRVSVGQKAAAAAERDPAMGMAEALAFPEDRRMTDLRPMNLSLFIRLMVREL